MKNQQMQRMHKNIYVKNIKFGTLEYELVSITKIEKLMNI